MEYVENRFREFRAGLWGTYKESSELLELVIREREDAERQVAAIEMSIAEGERRCEDIGQMVTWDGKQPDTWLKAGKAWRKPNDKDIGKLVRVTNQLGVNPEKLPEAELTGFVKHTPGEPSDIITRGTKGEGVCWPYAWIESFESDSIDTDGKCYVSVQVDGVEMGTPPSNPDSTLKAFSAHGAKVGLADGLVQAWTPDKDNPAKFKPLIEKFREPTLADVVFGNVECDVRDTPDEDWRQRKLLAVLPDHLHRRFITDYPQPCGRSNSWRYARIRVS